MAQPNDATQEFLSAVYGYLDLKSGSLLNASDEPTADVADWLNKGQWLSLAKAAGVEKVFFVGDDPILVFARCGSDGESVRRAFNRIWCMARPRRLFLATQGELLVCDLTRPPVRKNEPLEAEQRLLNCVRQVRDVQAQLQSYHRSLVESGRIPGDSLFADDVRADRALVEDLNRVRDALIAEKKPQSLPVVHAHSLIGRSIFIRYLEDRRILLKEDFVSVAAGNAHWEQLLEQPVPGLEEPEGRTSYYLRILSDTALTYKIFEKLTGDFNGDMFPISDAERDSVAPRHLHLLQQFLGGAGISDQPRLFFFAYSFDVIPIDLISSIYESFYKAGDTGSAGHGVHYTPSALVEHVLSKVLTPECLQTAPRIIDPACGSGIFLVEAFRRIVRFRCHQKRERLSLDELKSVLRDQIAGIEINPEAVRIAAFSLYLALLNYVDPPDIWRDKRLPCLKFDPDHNDADKDHLNILVAANAFEIEEIPNVTIRQSFGSACASVVVGNPPWGSPDAKSPVAARDAARAAFEWCLKRELPVGDKELSQAFIHRTLDLLCDTGVAGLLVSTGVFFKGHPLSRDFRKSWLRQARIDHVVNFMHVRDLYFESGIAPFASVVFEKTAEVPDDHLVEYWSAKKTAIARQRSAAVMSKADRKLVRQRDLLCDDRLWKVYWWGNHHDHALISALELNPKLEQVQVNGKTLVTAIGRGLEGGTKAPSRELSQYSLLPTKALDRYGPLDLAQLQPTPRTRGREGKLAIYEGTRILLNHGPRQKDDANGVLVATLATEPFCVKHSVHGIRFDDTALDEPKIILGILWSSIARYFFWMTAGSWGPWHHKLSEDHIRRLPVKLPSDARLRDRIVTVVDNLLKFPSRHSGEKDKHEEEEARRERIRAHEAELDSAVYELYELTDVERDLVDDMCIFGLEFFYRDVASTAADPVDNDRSQWSGVESDLPSTSARGSMSTYLRAFLTSWNRELGPDGEFNWKLLMPSVTCPMIGVVFSMQPKGALPPTTTNSLEREWDEVLRELDRASIHHDGSRRLFIDGMARVVTDALTQIIILKRNEKRLWTASAAREDAEATIVQAMNANKS